MTRNPIRFAAVVAAVALASCGGGGGSHPPVSPTAAPTSTPVQSAFVCPSSDSSSSVARYASRGTGDATRHMVSRGRRASRTTGLLAVVYDGNTAARSAASIASTERSTGAKLVRSYTFTHLNQVVHVLSVGTSNLATVEASLRAQAGVKSVGLTGQARFRSTVSTPYFPNDPYFNGFPANGALPATYHVPPYEETSDVPGQWDMHATKLEYAFGYSQPGNGSTITNGNALGASGIRVAIIDTGEDTTHPELQGKIVYQKCFITDPSGVQSVSNFTTDPDGHGTDVAGIAGENTGNAFGFTAAGGDVSLMGYRVYPTPDDNCTNESNNDPQCEASTTDIASAINDAVTNGASVISMSLGGNNTSGPNCTNGADSDPVEGAAVEDAIAAKVVVVAAAGNDGSPGSPQPLEAPACDAGVIAVGASALGDGSPNGSGTTVGSPAAPVEYVAAYSDVGTPAASPKSASAWGIVAPGGDPTDANDVDNLHWIENIWTSTPYMANASDTSFEGECTDDYPNDNGLSIPVDCRTLIAGTSMATPHVAGAAALIISVNATYKSPTLMKQLLCTTADDISDPNEGCGRLNTYRAMAYALGDPSKP